jgi:hypothetical protein
MAESDPDMRPMDARPGTRTGALWEALSALGTHSTAALADDAGMVPESARQALTGWARLGLIDRHDTPTGVQWSGRLSQSR